MSLLNNKVFQRRFSRIRVNVKRPENNPDLRNTPVTVDLKVTEMGSFIAWRYPRQITIPMGEIDASVPISISTSMTQLMNLMEKSN